MKKTYVQFFYKGLIEDEIEEREVKTRNPSEITVPKGAYGFRFYDRTEKRVGRETLYGNARNFSVSYVLGTLKTIAQVRREKPRSNVLENMIMHGYEKAVKTRNGDYVSIGPKDVVLAPK